MQGMFPVDQVLESLILKKSNTSLSYKHDNVCTVVQSPCCA